MEYGLSGLMALLSSKLGLFIQGPDDLEGTGLSAISKPQPDINAGPLIPTVLTSVMF